MSIQSIIHSSIDIADCDNALLETMGNQLLTHSRDITNFEETSRKIADSFYDNLLVNGKPLFALLRIFRYTAHKDLHPDLKKLTDQKQKYSLVLMASRGIEKDWNDHTRSKKHRVIPVGEKPIVLDFEPLLSSWSKAQSAEVSGETNLKTIYEDIMTPDQFMPYITFTDIQRGVVRKVNNYRKHHFQHPKIAESNENITQKYDLVVGNINR